MMQNILSVERIMCSLINQFPKELKEEIVKYSEPFAFILYKTDLFLVSEHISDYSQMTLTSWASKEGYISLLIWARKSYRCHWNYKRICFLAAREGHLHILRWAKSQLVSNAIDYVHLWDGRTLEQAAYRGHFLVVKWLKENGCYWDTFTCAAAALGGHLEILKWLQENGCPWDGLTYSYAAAHGHFHILKWLREKRDVNVSGMITVENYPFHKEKSTVEWYVSSF